MCCITSGPSGVFLFEDIQNKRLIIKNKKNTFKGSCFVMFLCFCLKQMRVIMFAGAPSKFCDAKHIHSGCYPANPF